MYRLVWDAVSGGGKNTFSWRMERVNFDGKPDLYPVAYFLESEKALAEAVVRALNDSATVVVAQPA